MNRVKRKSPEEHENHERWLVSYADFITLMFAFFVVMYATSTQNEEKEKQFEESIRERFHLPSPGGGGSGAGTGARQLANVSSDQESAADRTQARLVESAETQEALEKNLFSKMSQEELKRSISSLRHDALGVRMSLAASSFFPSGSAKLKREALPTLDKIGSILKDLRYKLLIEGHTDDQPLSKESPFESNWELSSARATQVIRYFEKLHGISPKRMAAMSYADQKPIVPNNSEENRAKNRRIEILIITGDNPLED